MRSRHAVDGGVGVLLRKPLSVALAQSDAHDAESPIERHLTLFDLVMIGAAGTIGSGVFTLVGLIAHSYAGPASFISFAVAGIACVFSGISYAELAGLIPAEGGAYSYAFVALGELPAFIAGLCLTLEFGVSGSAIARVWSDKIVAWNDTRYSEATAARDGFELYLLDPVPALQLSPLAGVLMLACVGILLKV